MTSQKEGSSITGELEFVIGTSCIIRFKSTTRKCMQLFSKARGVEGSSFEELPLYYSFGSIFSKVPKTYQTRELFLFYVHNLLQPGFNFYTFEKLQFK